MFDFGPFFERLQQHNDSVREAAAAAVDQFGEQLIGNAQEYAPIETGALQASGTATDAQIEGDQITKVVGFNTDYAAARHERPPELDAPPKQNPKGQYKFLEKAMQELAPRFTTFVGGKVDEASGSGQ